MNDLIPMQSIFDEGPFTEEETSSLQPKLWHLLARQTDYYTMGGSSSVRVELAEELYKSILFTLAEGLKYGAFTREQLLASEKLEHLLRAGREEVEKQVETGKRLWLQVQYHPTGIMNISYDDTLKGLVTFFKSYDIRYFAHQIPGDIDYQLCHAVPDELPGIKYVNEYLRRLLIENSFISCFETDNVNRLLQCYCPDPYGQLINLFEPVAVNALGLALVKEDIYTLNLTVEMKQSLINGLQECDRTTIYLFLEKAADDVASILKAIAPASEYIKRTVAELVPRIEALLPTGNIDGIFLTLP